MGPEAPGAGGRRAAGAVGGARRGLLRQGLRRHLPRPAAHAGRRARAARPTASRSPRCSSSPRSACSPASCRASSSTRWRRWSQALVGGRMPVQTGDRVAVDRADRREPQLLQRPAGVPVHRRLRRRSRPSPSIASPRDAAAPRRRPGIAAFPIRARATQYTAGSFAQPIRRVFGTRRVPRARARSRCRRPATCAPARLTVELRDLVWDALYAPIAGGVGFAADRLNYAAVPDHPPAISASSSRRSSSCCWCSRYGRDPRSRRAGRADAAGAAAGAAADRLRAQGQGAAAAPPGPAAAPALSRSAAADAQGGGAGGQRLLAVPRRPLSDLRRDLGGGRAGADLRHRPAVQLVGRSHRHHRAARQRALLPGAGRAWTSAPASAASARAAR